MSQGRGASLPLVTKKPALPFGTDPLEYVRSLGGRAVLEAC